MTQALCLATYSLSALDPRGEVACVLAIRQLGLDLYYSSHDFSLFLIAPRPEGGDLSEFESHEEKSLLKSKVTYSFDAIKALTHPVLAVLSKAGLQGEMRYWSQEININQVIEESFSEIENAVVFALDLYKRELSVYENLHMNQERILKNDYEGWLKNQVP